jgi:hypothetical protein
VSPLARQLAREWAGNTPANAGHIKQWFNADLMQDADMAALLKNCSAVVGLHPVGNVTLPSGLALLWGRGP